VLIFRPLWRPVLDKVGSFSSVFCLQLEWLDELQSLGLLPWVDHDEFSFLTFCEEGADDPPDPAQTGRVVKEGPFSDTAVDDSYLLDFLPEGPDRYGGERHASEIDYEGDLFCVVGYHSVVVNHEHEVVVSVEKILEAFLKVDPINSDDDDRSEPLIVPVGIYNSAVETVECTFVEISNDGIAMMVNDFLEPVDDLFFVEFCHIRMLEYHFVTDPTSIGAYFSRILWCCKSILTSLIVCNSLGLKGTL
jgi:hypothetical protein